MWGIILRMKTVPIRATSLICWSTVLVLCHSQLKPSSSIHLSQCEFTVLYDILLPVSVLCISCSCPQIWRWPPCWNIDQTKHKEFQTMLDIGHLKIYFISPNKCNLWNWNFYIDATVHSFAQKLDSVWHLSISEISLCILLSLLSRSLSVKSSLQEI